MKAIPGKIVITDKVYFEYYDDGKPEHKLLSEFFGFDTEKYEASKQLIEVDNATKKLKGWYYDVVGIHCKNTDWTLSGMRVTDNQNCKAEIENNKAIIISLIKE